MLVVILTGVWMGHYRGGFGWSADNVFNWHPLLMVLSLVYLYGNGNFYAVLSGNLFILYM